MKLAQAEREFIYESLWKARLKNELCKSDFLINQIAMKRYRPLSASARKELNEYIVAERKKVSREYRAWEKNVLLTIQNKLSFVPEKVVRRWEYLGLSKKVDINFFLFLMGEVFYCSGNRNISDEDIYYDERPLSSSRQ
jgi:hypothetical protein